MIFRLGLPGGGYFAIRSYGVCLAAAVLMGWYFTVHTSKVGPRKKRARAYAGAMVAGALAGMVATYAGASGAFMALAASASMFAVLSPARDAYAPAVCAFWILGGMGAWLDGWLYGTVAGEGFASWGAFPTGSPAHAAHRAGGIIDAASTHSRPTHPVALYHSLVGFFALPFALRLRGSGLALPAVMFAFGGALLGFDILRDDAFAGASSLALGLLVVALSIASAMLVVGSRAPLNEPESE